MSTGAQGVSVLTFDAGAQAAEYSTEVVTVDSNPNNGTWVTGLVSGSGYIFATAYGLDMFVAISNASDVANTSTDGITWSQHALPAVRGWMGVAYGNGMFIAICNTSADTAISTDGFTWTAGTIPLWDSLISIAFGNGVFVVLSSNSATALTSSDGIIWSTSTLPGTGWGFLAFGAGVFVALERDSTIAVSSPDGINWTQRVVPALRSWRGAAYGNGTFVAVSTATITCVTSPDGFTWTAGRLSSTANWYDVTFSNNRFIAVGSNVTGYAYSTNGIRWTRVYEFPEARTAIESGGGIVVALGNASWAARTLGPNTRTLTTLNTLITPAKPVPGSNFATVTITGQTALTATDAIDCWIQGTDSTASHNAYEHQITPIRLAVTNVIAGVGFDITAYSDLRLDGDFQVRWAWVGGVGEKVGSAVINFPASAQAAEYSTSEVVTDSNPNNSTLIRGALTYSLLWSCVGYGNGMFVAAVSNSTLAASSTDGVNWTQRAMPAGLGWTAMTYGNGLFLATCYSSAASATSTDGLTWTPSATIRATSTCFGAGLFVCGTTAGISTTPDGSVWTTRTAPRTNPFLAYGGGIFLGVIPGTAFCITSPDGIVWTEYPLPVSGSWQPVTYGNGVFVVMAFNSNIVLVSPDGITWVQGTSPLNGNWWGIAFGDGVFLAVTNGSGIAKSVNGLNWTLLSDSAPCNSVCFGDSKFVAVGNTRSVSICFLAGDSRTITTLSTETSPAAPVPGTNSTSLTVTGLTTFNATDAVEVWVQGSDTTADHNEVEHALAPIQLRATNPVSGEGFTIVATSPHRLDGDFKVRFAFTP